MPCGLPLLRANILARYVQNRKMMWRVVNGV